MNPFDGPKFGVELLDRHRAKRVARRTTRTHIGEMRKAVDTALRYRKWPPAAPTEAWLTEWSSSRQRLSGSKFSAVENVYGFVDEFKQGVHAGVHEFDDRGEDKDFFERFRSALEDADRVLA